MLRRIFKFQVHPWTGSIEGIEMPAGAKVISAASQATTIVVWAICDPTARRVKRLITAHGTGWDLPLGVTLHTFVSTVAVGQLVFHVFDGGEVE